MKGTENAFETIETIETIDSDRRLRFETDAPKRLLEKAGARVFPVERSTLVIARHAQPRR